MVSEGHLDVLYRKCENTSEDDVKGSDWTVLTAAPGNENAMKIIARASQEMTVRQMPEALMVAEDLRRR